MKSEYIIIMICSVFVASVSQILLKKSAAKEHAGFIKEYLNKFVIIGYLMLLASMFITIIAYRELPLKYGAVIESLGYVFVMILSSVFLGEKITKRKIIGNILIIVGIIVFSLKIF